MGQQLFMAAGYSSILLMPVLLALGVAVDAPYLAGTVATLVFPMMRIVFGAYHWRSPILWHESVATFLDRLPVGYGAVLFAAVAYVIDRIATGAAQSPAAEAGLGFSLWMTLLFATCPAHELIHRRKPLDASVGWFIAGLAGYPLLGDQHLRHHARHGDTAQAEWPRFDESAWSFAARRIRRIVVDAWSQGIAFLKPGLGRGQALRSGALLVILLTWAAFTRAGGLIGWLIYGGVAIGVTIGFQLINYLQHWGLGEDHLAGAGRSVSRRGLGGDGSSCAHGCGPCGVSRREPAGGMRRRVAMESDRPAVAPVTATQGSLRPEGPRRGGPAS